jgi:hypothetical protein
MDKYTAEQVKEWTKSMMFMIPMTGIAVNPGH